MALSNEELKTLRRQIEDVLRQGEELRRQEQADEIRRAVRQALVEERMAEVRRLISELRAELGSNAG